MTINEWSVVVGSNQRTNTTGHHFSIIYLQQAKAKYKKQTDDKYDPEALLCRLSMECNSRPN